MPILITELIFGHLFEHSSFQKICATCTEKINEFNQLFSLASQIRNELINLYEKSRTGCQFQEIEEVLSASVELNLEINNLSDDFVDEIQKIQSANENNEILKTEDDNLSDEFKKIIDEQGLKYDYSVFQREFGDNIKNYARKFFCDSCQIEFKNFNNLLIHQNDHEKSMLMDSNAFDSSCDTKFKCFCGKGFCHKISFTQHLKIHNNIRDYPCTYDSCSFQAINMTHLKRHIRAKHTLEKNHQCKYCGRKFAEKYNMTSHIRKQHLNEKS